MAAQYYYSYGYDPETAYQQQAQQNAENIGYNLYQTQQGLANQAAGLNLDRLRMQGQLLGQGYQNAAQYIQNGNQAAYEQGRYAGNSYALQADMQQMALQQARQQQDYQQQQARMLGDIAQQRLMNQRYTQGLQMDLVNRQNADEVARNNADEQLARLRYSRQGQEMPSSSSRYQQMFGYTR